VCKTGRTPAVTTIFRHQVASTQGKGGRELCRSNATDIGPGRVQQSTRQEIAHPRDAVRRDHDLEECGGGRNEQGILGGASNRRQRFDGRPWGGQLVVIYRPADLEDRLAGDPERSVPV
jgi:hypothetical protein